MELTAFPFRRLWNGIFKLNEICQKWRVCVKDIAKGEEENKDWRFDSSPLVTKHHVTSLDGWPSRKPFQIQLNCNIH